MDFPCFRSRHVFDRRKSESQVCHSSNQSENSEMYTFLRSSPAPDRTLFNRPIPRRSRVAPPCRFFDEDACLSIDAHVRSLKSGSFLYVRERCPPLSSARVLFYAARQVLLAAPRQRILLRSYNDVR